MPLTGTGAVLGDKIADLIISPDAPPAMRDQIKARWESIGAVIVDHFIENTIVNPGIPVAIAGSPPSQTGATSAPGTLG